MSEKEFLGFTNQVGLKRVIWLSHGNKVSRDYGQKSVAIIERLRREESVKREVLLNEVGLNPRSDNDQEKFNRIIRPLRGNKKVNPLGISFIGSNRSGNSTRYYLSRDAFDRDMNKVIASIRNIIETEPRKRVQELEDKVEEKNKRIRELEQKVEDLQ